MLMYCVLTSTSCMYSSMHISCALILKAPLHDGAFSCSHELSPAEHRRQKEHNVKKKCEKNRNERKNINKKDRRRQKKNHAMTLGLSTVCLSVSGLV